MEKNAILSALRFTSGNKDLTAKLLGISRSTLFRKLKSYKIEDSKLLEHWLSAQRELALWILKNDHEIRKVELDAEKLYSTHSAG